MNLENLPLADDRWARARKSESRTPINHAIVDIHQFPISWMSTIAAIGGCPRLRIAGRDR